MTATEQRLRGSGQRDQQRGHRRAWIVGAIAALMVVIGALAWLLWFSPWFNVSKVQVTVASVGAAEADLDLAAEVEVVAAVPPGTSIASVSVAEIETRVMALPGVRSVSVERLWPDTIALVVTPRLVVAAAAGPDGYDLVDVEGMVVRESDNRPAKLPLVRASGAGLASALTVAAELPEWLREETDQIEASTRNNVTLVLRDGAIVRWGSAESVDLKVSVLTALMPGDWAVYDVSAPEVPTTA